MDKLLAKELIINKFKKTDGLAVIPLMKSDKTFTATYTDEGIQVSNLRNQSLLSWEVFYKTIELLNQNGGKAIKGDAMNGRLGDSKLPIDSIEGYIAYKVYGKEIGDSVFRRISPISDILIWSGICENDRGLLKLNKGQGDESL